MTQYKHTIQVNITNNHGELHKVKVHTPGQLTDLLDKVKLACATYTVPNRRNYRWVNDIVASNKQPQSVAVNAAKWPF